jgi:hypothetical protein
MNWPKRRLGKADHEKYSVKALAAGLAIGAGLALFGLYGIRPANDEDVGRSVIQQSLASYPGPCPCPYSILRGSPCGDWSAYVKPGGYSPICYSSDVTWRMIDDYKTLHPDWQNENLGRRMLPAFVTRIIEPDHTAP